MGLNTSKSIYLKRKSNLIELFVIFTKLPFRPPYTHYRFFIRFLQLIIFSYNSYNYRAFITAHPLYRTVTRFCEWLLME